MAEAASENSLQSLLRAGIGVGAAVAANKLFGSQRADAQDLQRERNFWNQVNGSGPVNSADAQGRARSWTEFLFGAPPGSMTPGADQAQRPGLPPFLWLAAGAVLVWWFLVRR